MADAADDHIVEIDDLSFSRGERRIFAGLDMKIRRKEITAIMGPSGTGKTTLLRLITGQLAPDTGTVRLNSLVVNDSMTCVAILGCCFSRGHCSRITMSLRTSRSRYA